MRNCIIYLNRCPASKLLQARTPDYLRLLLPYGTVCSEKEPPFALCFIPNPPVSRVVPGLSI